LRTREVELSLPRFQIDTSLSLAETLAGMGMQDAFGGAADFSRMSEETEMMISDVIHRAQIEVDERGAEAAAAAGVSLAPKSVAPGESVRFQADRPFFFCIAHQLSGAILFAGQVCDPRLGAEHKNAD
jgi:serpin B